MVESASGLSLVRAMAAILWVAGGLSLVSVCFGPLGWSWILWLAVGFGAGIVAGNGRLAWAAAAGVGAWAILGELLHLPRDQGPFWWLGTMVVTAGLLVAFLVGGLLVWRASPGAAARSWFRRRRPRVRFGLVAGLIAVLVALVAYTAYIGQAGSSEFVHPATGDSDCRTPDLMGWEYEAINYDPADDARLAATSPNRTACSSQGVKAGSEVVTADGTRLAGWYIPAEDGIGPTGPTLVVVHGFRSNKSGSLVYGAPFHPSYNLVILDLRNSGRSSGDQTTMGLREQDDVRAMIDWLERSKHPSWVGLVGNSMGGATALAEAADDPRVRAVIADSTHARILTSVGNVLETEHGQPALPGSWAIVNLVSLAVGGDVTSVDPIRSIVRLGDRPVLLIQGTKDVVDPPEEASDLNFHAALKAGVPVELQYCPGAGHGLVIETCADAWAAWSTSFLERSRIG